MSFDVFCLQVFILSRELYYYNNNNSSCSRLVECEQETWHVLTLAHTHTHTCTHTHAQTCTHTHTHTHAQTYTHTHTHTHTHTKQKTKCKELPHWVTPPQPKAGAPVCYFRELWASTRQTPEAGPSTRRSTDCALQLWCGHPKSHLDLSGISTASGLVHPQPRPGSQFTIFLGPG